MTRPVPGADTGLANGSNSNVNGFAVAGLSVFARLDEELETTPKTLKRKRRRRIDGAAIRNVTGTEAPGASVPGTGWVLRSMVCCAPTTPPLAQVAPLAEIRRNGTAGGTPLASRSSVTSKKAGAVIGVDPELVSVPFRTRSFE